MVEPYLIVCAALLLGSVLARALPVTRRSFGDDYEDGWDLTPRELAYLRRGAYGVVLTVLAELHGVGSIDLSGRRPRRLDPRHDLDDRLAVAVYAGLTWFRRPRLLARLPRVRRACALLRSDLRERGLLPPRRRRVFAVALLGYAGGLATATALENDLRGSTVVSALAVWGVAALLARGPRRTVAGLRELRAHRRALARVAAQGEAEAAYLADLVAAYGLVAARELCGRFVPAGALAPPPPAYEPRPVGVPAPTVVEPVPIPEPIPIPEPARVVRPGVEPAFVDRPLVEPAPSRWRPVLVPVPPPVVVELPVRRPERLPVAA